MSANMTSKKKEITIKKWKIVIKLCNEKLLWRIDAIVGKSHATMQYILNDYKKTCDGEK